ncbi:MAG: 3-deoxy-D-manno-octulosonic acid transferase [Opitutales bacterium]
MIVLYRIFFVPALLLALPYYLFRMWRRGGYGKDFQHRFGRFRHLNPSAAGKTRIWLQAVSVGEVLAVGPLIEALQEKGSIEIVLTTTTSTGYAEARKRYADQVLSIGIFPLDFWLCSRLAWKRIQPDAIILTESELWPEHLHQAKMRRVPAYLVNARMSDRSFARYQKFPALIARLLGKFSAIFAASEHDAARLKKLTPVPGQIQSVGSIKVDVPLPDPIEEKTRLELTEELGFVRSGGPPPLVLLGSSTWPGEEAVLIELVHKIRQSGTDLRLLLVPRHAERRAEIITLLAKQGSAWHQRSTERPPEKEIIIHLADTTGELSRLSQIADFAFIGKSLPPNQGGQTPIEATGLGVPVLMGPNMQNFKEVAKSLLRFGAGQTVQNSSELEQSLLTLIQNQDKRQAMGTAGREWHQKNRGSSRRIAVAILRDLL